MDSFAHVNSYAHGRRQEMETRLAVVLGTFNRMIHIQLLKTYTYRGIPIYVMQMDGVTFAYFFIFRNKLFFKHFEISEKKKLKYVHVGGAAFLVCQFAEYSIDEVIRKNSWWDRIWRFDTEKKKPALMYDEA